MPPKSTFIPRIKVPYQFSNIKLNRPKMGIRVVSSKSLSASMRKQFTNCEQDYMAYDAGIFDKKNITFMPRFGYVIK